MWKGYELWKLYCKISMLRRNEKSAVHRCVKSSFSEKCEIVKFVKFFRTASYSTPFFLMRKYFIIKSVSKTPKP